MTCIVDETPLPVRGEGFWHKLSRVLRARRRQRLPPLDPRELPDHLKRDLGFLDGRG